MPIPKHPPEVSHGVTATTKTPGASRAIRHPSSACRPVQGLPVPRRVTFICKFNPLAAAAPPAQGASFTPAYLLLRVASPHRDMSLIRADLLRRGRRRSFPAMPSKTSTYYHVPDWVQVFIFFRSGRCYSWFVAVDQDNSGEISPQELRERPLFESCDQFYSRGVTYRKRTYR